jgi:hypothetical protein
LVAEALWLTELLLSWAAETEALCEIAPPATAAISTSFSWIRSVILLTPLIGWERG